VVEKLSQILNGQKEIKKGQQEILAALRERNE
jgi:hypothetical protein